MLILFPLNISLKKREREREREKERSWTYGLWSSPQTSKRRILTRHTRLTLSFLTLFTLHDTNKLWFDIYDMSPVPQPLFSPSVSLCLFHSPRSTPTNLERLRETNTFTPFPQTTSFHHSGPLRPSNGNETVSSLTNHTFPSFPPESVMSSKSEKRFPPTCYTQSPPWYDQDIRFGLEWR